MKKQKLKKLLFFFLGIICLVLAYLGIVLPGFPGTPFILLTGYFFFRSSDKMYAWLMKQRLFAKLIGEYEKNPVIPLRLKIIILIPFLISIVVAEFIFVKTLTQGIIVGGIGLAVTILVFLLKKARIEKKE